MLPIFRLIPVGGVFLAIAILLLALNPPRATSPSARVAMLPARGALLDRGEHPEWRQFLLQAALRRAGEVERLRDLQDTLAHTEIPSKPKVVVPAPVIAEPEATAPVAAEQELSEPAVAEPEVAEPKTAEAPSVDAKPDVAEAAPVEAGPDATKPQAAEVPPAEAKPDVAAAESIEVKPEISEPAAAAPTTVAAPKAMVDEPKVAEAAPRALEPKATEVVPIEVQPDAAESKPAVDEPKIAAAAPIATAPTTTTPEPIAVKPASKASKTPLPAQVASIEPATLPEAKPAVAAAPSRPEGAALLFRHETDGSRVRTEATPPVTAPVTKPPASVKVAAVPEKPVQPVQYDDGDVTGSIEPAANGATIPVGIGEASSTELQVTLPRERPPILLRLDRRARESKVEQVRRRVHHVSRARTRKGAQAGSPADVDFFALLFKAFAGDLKPRPFRPPTIPYQPNNGWKAQ